MNSPTPSELVKMTPREFAGKVDWEGGVMEALLSYGLSATDMDDSDPQFKQAWADLEKHVVTLKPMVVKLDLMIERLAEEDPEG